jgi:hypothetical protein
MMRDIFLPETWGEPGAGGTAEARKWAHSSGERCTA